ncbi:unnamed protein product [Mycena citricolor]|uniref:Cupin-like domain-containing protein n=1 Tax=Mycena citricolor TaxID=2018698 RepID=A0AAD2HQ95_9AGAR|nr:unnamed protein product [Mycena citricolor]
MAAAAHRRVDFCATLLPPLQAIAKLDAAIIISGCAGTGRLDLVLEIIQQLQDHCSGRLAPSPLSSSPCYHPIQPLAATSLPTERSIPVLSRGPSLSAFQTQHYQSPFVIRDYASHWPALNEHPWASTQYLRSVAGPGRVVPVEVGRDYRTEDWTQKIMPWDDFLDSLDDHSETTLLYLAQHSLFMQFPALRYDIEVSDYAYAEIPRQGFDPPANEEQLVINAWLGPRNTVSPAHTDPYFNIYVQVVGQKTVWLAPPSAGELMQAEKNTAGIDVFGPEDRPASLDGLGSAAILNPGDLVWLCKDERPVAVAVNVTLLMSVLGGPMRLSSPSLTLTTGNISDALSSSPDGGATLVFLKKSISDIPDEAVEELAALGREMPEDETLDTLDISHNKIKRLPTQPGKLLNLRVFSVARNKLTRLPIYLSKFYKLEVLKLERNPIEWPPKSVVFETAAEPESPQAMREWIRNLQTWIESETSRPRIHEDSGYSEQELEGNLEDSFHAWKRYTPVPEKDFDAGVTPHARSFSIDSNLSASSLAESQDERDSASYNRPPPLRLGILGSFSPEGSPTRSFESYLPSPADSDKFFDEPTQHPPRKDSLRNVQPPEVNVHARNASYASGTRNREREHSVPLPGKQSMPDLRTAKLNFTRKAPELPVRHAAEDSFPSPSSLRKDSDSSGSSSAAIRPHRTHGSPSRPAETGPSMAFERNSYFRRMSKLPVAAISNTLPEPLLKLIDSVRSILFAMCQVYQSLEHYTIHAPDERLKTVLRKVLDPASSDMMQLINSLDRFDALSRKTLPPHMVCRGVVESCRDTVASFAKAISVVSLQLKVIAGADDVRYLRSMLLMLYGATAEVAAAWKDVLPHIETIAPSLHAKGFSPMSMASPDVYPGSAPPAHHQFLGADHSPPPMLRTHPIGRIRTARRHAGSFSSKDVEIGKKLPSYDDGPLFSSGVVTGSASHTPTPRTTKRYLPAPFTGSITVSSPSPSGDGPSSRANSHSRAGSQASLHASSSSASLSGASASSSPSIPSKAPSSLELPSSSKTQVDKEALHAIQAAVDVAPTVWNQIEHALADSLDPEVRESLDRARAVTRRLADLTKSVQDGIDSSVDRKLLREDSNLFLKTVVQLSNIIKQYGDIQSTVLRSNLVRLTNSTEEFAILLHVSSFSPLPPTNGARSYSPMPPASPALSTISGLNSGGLPLEEFRLTSNLSRSRSAQTSVSAVKLAVQEQPRSALPLQTFKVPPPLSIRKGKSTVGEAG